MHGRPYLSLCPVTLQHFSSDVDEYADGCLFEKGAALYPFRPGGGTGRGGRSGGFSPKIGRAFLQNTIPCLLYTFINITWMQDAFALSEPILVAIQLIYNTLPSISHCSSPDYFCVVCWRPELKFPYTLNSLPRICSLHVSCISLSLLPPRTRIEAHRGMDISCPPFFCV